MFARREKPSEVNKASQKVLDAKKDYVTRWKKLKIVIENWSDADLHKYFDANYSVLFDLFIESFAQVEADLKLRVNKAHKDELDQVLTVLSKFLVYLPELIHRKWMFHCIGSILRKLLHAANALKIRREAMRLFLLWYQILNEAATLDCHMIFASLVPNLGYVDTDFDTDGFYFKSQRFDYVVSLERNQSVLADKGYLEQPQVLQELFSYITNEVLKIRWKNSELHFHCLSFLINMFKKFYLSIIFPSFRFDLSIYDPCLDIPGKREYPLIPSGVVGLDTSDQDSKELDLMNCQQATVRWIIDNVQRQRPDERIPTATVTVSEDVVTYSRKKLHSDPPSENSLSSPRTANVYNRTDSPATSEENEQTISPEVALMRAVLYSSRENINIVHEIFRQAFLLPMNCHQTIRRVLKVYEDWLVHDRLHPPIFIYEPPLDSPESLESSPDDSAPPHSATTIRSMSYRGALSQISLDSNLEPNVQAGIQKVCQVFITNASNIFLMKAAPTTQEIDIHSRICKRVLSVYRDIVVDIDLNKSSWEQLLMVLLKVIQLTLGEDQHCQMNKQLAPHLFQTTIVTWVKASLTSPISKDHWDTLLEVLSSLTDWTELIAEWAKTMEVLTRVLARYTYCLNIDDLPLERANTRENFRFNRTQTGINTNARSSNKGSSPRLNSQNFVRNISQHEPELTREADRESFQASHGVRASASSQLPFKNQNQNVSRQLSLPACDYSADAPASSSGLGFDNLPANNVFDSDDLLEDNSGAISADNVSYDPSAGSIGEGYATTSGADDEDTDVSPQRSLVDSRARLRADSVSPIQNVPDSDSTVLSPRSNSEDNLVIKSQSSPLLARPASLVEDKEIEFKFDTDVSSARDSRRHKKQASESMKPLIDLECSSLRSSSDSDSLGPDIQYSLMENGSGPTSKQSTIERGSRMCEEPDLTSENENHESDEKVDDLVTTGDDMNLAIDLGNLDGLFPSTKIDISMLENNKQSSEDLSTERDEPAKEELKNDLIDLDSANDETKDDISPKIASDEDYNVDNVDSEASSVKDETNLDVTDPLADNSKDDTPNRELDLSTVEDQNPPLETQQQAGAGDNVCTSNNMATKSVLAGGGMKGWLPEVAIVMWRRMLGIMGNINEVGNPETHALIMHHLLIVCNTLNRIRDNMSISTDGKTTPSPPELVPPTLIIVPWLFQSQSLSDAYKSGKLIALQLICTFTVRNDNLPLSEEHLAQFYRTLHYRLTRGDLESKATIIRYTSPRLFSSGLPGCLILLSSISKACCEILDQTMNDLPYSEALVLLGSTICLINSYPDAQLFDCNKQTTAEASASVSSPEHLRLFTKCCEIKESIIESVCKACKRYRESVSGISGPLPQQARLNAVYVLTVYLYEELTQPARYVHVRECVSAMLTLLDDGDDVLAIAAWNGFHMLSDKVTVLINYNSELVMKLMEQILTIIPRLVERAQTHPSSENLASSAIYCLLVWSMCLPLSLLRQSTLGACSLLHCVFSVLHEIIADHGLSQMKRSQTFESGALHRSNPDFTPSPQTPVTPKSLQDQGFSTLRKNDDQNFNIRVSALFALRHLTTYLGHFALPGGASRLHSSIQEHNDFQLPLDIIPNPLDDLVPEIFSAPNVQFFCLNGSTLISFIELPSDFTSMSSQFTAGLNSDMSVCRVITRDLVGKMAWDSAILYSASEWPLYLCGPTDPCPEEVIDIDDFLEPYLAPHRFPLDSTLTSKYQDDLDKYAVYLEETSPECRLRACSPLNAPTAPVNDDVCGIEQQCIGLIRDQKAEEENHRLQHPHRRRPPITPADSLVNMTALPSVRSVQRIRPPFQVCRQLLEHFGFLSWENRNRFHLLKKTEGLLLELKHLDQSVHCRETHKIAVIYVAKGQEDKQSILSNDMGSSKFEQFVSGLGWEVDLLTHAGFRAGLPSNGDTGRTAPYYANTTVEVMYHVSTRMASDIVDNLHIKMKHIGNDEVHIVWSENSRDYRTGIIQTQFGDVLIIIYPLPNALYRVQIIKKNKIAQFGPLFDGAIVSESILPALVRETALNASRTVRSHRAYPFYQILSRANLLSDIVQKFRQDTTFEDFATAVFAPRLPDTEVMSRSSSENSLSGFPFIPDTLDTFNTFRVQPSTPGVKPKDATSHGGPMGYIKGAFGSQMRRANRDSKQLNVSEEV